MPTLLCRRTPSVISASTSSARCCRGRSINKYILAYTYISISINVYIYIYLHMYVYSPQTNSFEQLCINFVNEMLQEQFNESVFASERRLFAAEGVSVEDGSLESSAERLRLMTRLLQVSLSLFLSIYLSIYIYIYIYICIGGGRQRRGRISRVVG